MSEEFKINMPLFNINEEAELENILSFHLDEYTNEIMRTMTKDKDIIILKKVIEKQQKEIKKLKEEQSKRNWVHIKENGEVEPLFYISKDKIRDYFAHDLAFKRRLIREKEEISDYNRGKFDTIEDLLERLEDNKWN